MVCSLCTFNRTTIFQLHNIFHTAKDAGEGRDGGRGTGGTVVFWELEGRSLGNGGSNMPWQCCK